MTTKENTTELYEKMSLENLRATLAEKGTIVASLTRKIRTNTKRAAKLQESREMLQKELRVMEQEKEKIQECIIALTPIADDILSIRSEYIQTAELSGKDDITVKEQAWLRDKTKKLLAALQRACDHRFVLDFAGYEGSRSMDYDDARCGKRVCLVCSLQETSLSHREDLYQNREDMYQTLTGVKSRLIKRIVRDEKSFTNALRPPTLFPLPFITKAFIRAPWDIVNLSEETENQVA